MEHLSLHADNKRLVATRTFERCARAPDVSRAQEWRNTQRSLGQLRYMDESHVERGRTNKSRGRQVLPLTRGLCEREQCLRPLLWESMRIRVNR